MTALPVFHRNFDLPNANQHHIPSPYPYRNPAGSDPAAVIASSVKALRDKVAELGADNVAAFFCEPIQGSGGVIVPPVGWLKAMRETARELDILFLADEVITGFGRTGPMFACAAEGVTPDIMTVAKGLTAGYVPMGAVLLGEHVYAGIADGAAPDVMVGHGYTYSGHPSARRSRWRSSGSMKPASSPMAEGRGPVRGGPRAPREPSARRRSPGARHARRARARFEQGEENALRA